MSAAWQWVFRDPSGEFDGAVTATEGAIPPGLAGTFLRNGAGRQTFGATSFHLIDAHGMVAGLRFGEGRAHFTAREVKTDLLARETKAGAPLARRIFENLPGRRRNILNLDFAETPSHDLYAWGGKLLATANVHWRANELDATTFETKGPHNHGGTAKKGTNLAPMPHVDRAANRLISYRVKTALKDVVSFFEIAPDWTVAKTVTHALPAFSFIHDLAFTPNYYVLTRSPLTLSLPGALLGGSSIYGAFREVHARAIEIVLVPRDPASGRVACVCALPPEHRQTFHIANAFERDGKVVVLMSTYRERIAFERAFPPGERGKESPVPRGVVATADPATGEVSVRILDAVAGEAASVDAARAGQPTRFLYSSIPGTRGEEKDGGAYFWFHGVAKTDIESGDSDRFDFGASVYCSPPAFAARADATREDDGWVGVWLHDAAADRASFAVFDANAIAKGPIARIPVPVTIPVWSHVRFTSEPLLRAP